MTLIAKLEHGGQLIQEEVTSQHIALRLKWEGGIQESYIMPVSSLGDVTTEDHCCLCRCQMKKQVPHKLGALLDTCTKALKMSTTARCS